MEFTVDWAVAIGMFFLLIVWAFAFYAQLFTTDRTDLSTALDLIADTVLNNLSVQVVTVPMYVNYSNASIPAIILYADYIWPFGKTQSTVSRGSTLISNCNLSTTRIYWRGNLAAGRNVFTLRYTDNNASTTCTGFAAGALNSTRAVPQAAKISDAISRARLIVMNATSLSEFKTQRGINRDFNVTVETNDSVLISYGLPPPTYSNVYSKTVLGVLEETNQNVTLRFLTW